MTNITSIISASSITVFIDGCQHIVLKSDDRYTGVREAIKADNINDLRDVLTRKQLVENTNNTSSIRIVDGHVFYKQHELANTITARIIEMNDAGFNIEHMCKILCLRAPGW